MLEIVNWSQQGPISCQLMSHTATCIQLPPAASTSQQTTLVPIIFYLSWMVRSKKNTSKGIYSYSYSDTEAHWTPSYYIAFGKLHQEVKSFDQIHWAVNSHANSIIYSVKLAKVVTCTWKESKNPYHSVFHLFRQENSAVQYIFPSTGPFLTTSGLCKHHRVQVSSTTLKASRVSLLLNSFKKIRESTKIILCKTDYLFTIQKVHANLNITWTVLPDLFFSYLRNLWTELWLQSIADGKTFL